MAQKKAKSKTPPSKGVVGLLKKIVGRGSPASPRSAVSKNKTKGTDVKTKARANAKATKSSNGKQVASPPEPDKVKKKPPSITITRPEQTRPPVVLPPPRPLEAPIGAPSILVPKAGLPIASLTPIMRWMYVGGATRYEVEWSHDAHFGRGKSITLVSTQTAITLDAANELKPGTMYKWRVRGGNDAGWGPWSPPESFRSPDKI